MIGMQQIHGNKVVVVDKSSDGKTIFGCDGLITDDSNLTLSVKTADCLPILVTDKKGRIHGVIHAGWRGLHGKVIERAIKLIETKFKIKPGELIVYVGPHICSGHYEIKDDVAEFFDEIVVRGGKKYLDLALTATNQLINLGVLKKNIETDKTCTFEDKNLFSHRRDKTDKRNQYLFRLDV